MTRTLLINKAQTINKTTCVAEFEHAKIFLTSRQSDTLIITFDPWTNKNREIMDVFGKKFIDNHGYDHLFIRTSKNNWYGDICEDQLKELCNELKQGYKTTISFGSSMGGYAIFRFSCAINADVAISFSPQAFAGIEHIESETRWKDDWIQFSQVKADRFSDKTLHILVYDNKDKGDRIHAKALSAIPNSSEQLLLLEVPYAGHPVGNFLNETGLLKSFVTKIINGSISYDLFRDEIRKNRKNSHTYLFNLAQATRTRHPKCSLKIARHVTCIAPNIPKYRRYLSGVYYSSGYITEAVDQALLAHLLAINNSEYSLHLAFMYICSKKIALAKQILVNLPDSPKKIDLLRKAES